MMGASQPGVASFAPQRMWFLGIALFSAIVGGMLLLSTLGAVDRDAGGPVGVLAPFVAPFGVPIAAWFAVRSLWIAFTRNPVVAVSSEQLVYRADLFRLRPVSIPRSELRLIDESNGVLTLESRAATVKIPRALFMDGEEIAGTVERLWQLPGASSAARSG